MGLLYPLHKYSSSILLVYFISELRRILRLIRNQQPCNRRARQRTNRPRQHRTHGHPRDIAGPRWRQLRQHPDLVTQRADIREAAEGVGSDHARARGEVRVGGVVLQGVVGDEFILHH